MHFLSTFAVLAGNYLFMAAAVALIMLWGTEADQRRPELADTFEGIASDFGASNRVETCVWAGAMWPAALGAGVVWMWRWAHGRT